MVQAQAEGVSARRYITKSNEALERVRAAAQELHLALGDAAAKGDEAVRADLQDLPQKAKALVDSLQRSRDEEGGDTASLQLDEAVRFLEEMQRHGNESLAATGAALRTGLRQTMSDARDAVQKIGEALATKSAADDARTQTR